jgi:hypothetical protein
VSAGLYPGRPLDWSNDPALFASPDSRDQWLAAEGGPLGLAISCVIGKLGDLGYLGALFADLGGKGAPTAFTACFLNPESFGNLTVVSDDPFGELEIHSNLLDGADLDRMVECVAAMIDVLPNSFSEDFQMSAIGYIFVFFATV